MRQQVTLTVLDQRGCGHIRSSMTQIIDNLDEDLTTIAQRVQAYLEAVHPIGVVPAPTIDPRRITVQVTGLFVNPAAVFAGLQSTIRRQLQVNA